MSPILETPSRGAAAIGAAVAAVCGTLLLTWLCIGVNLSRGTPVLGKSDADNRTNSIWIPG